MKQVTDKVDLIHSIRKVTVIIFTVGALAFTMVGLLDRFGLVKSDTKKIRSDYIESQKQIIKTQVESTVMFINLAKDSGVSRENIIDSVQKIRFGTDLDGYIFIGQWDGLSLAGPGSGTNVIDIEDADGMKLVQKLIKTASEGGGYIEYRMPDISNKENEQKISYTQGINELEWYVGAGVYLDSLEKEIATLQKEAIMKTGMLALILVVILFPILLIFQLIFKRIAGAVADEIRLFSSYFESASAKSEEIDISNIRYREFSLIAEDMNRMVKNKLESDARIYASEQRLQMQRDQSPLGYVEYDLESNIIYWNPAAERIFGYSREEILGRSDKLIIPLEVLPEIRGTFKGLMDGSVSNDKGTKRINDNITKNGRRITCEWYNKALTDQNGEVLGIVSIVDDITDRKLAEDRLQESLEEKRILLKEVHHRVKNNMAIISSFISLQSMNIEDEYVRSLLQSSENRVRSMALIHEHLYKSENLKNINVQKYIDELVMTLLDSYGFGSADIDTKTEIIQFELDLDLLIPLGMLINEIISNALKHAYSNIEFPELSIDLIKGKQGELVLTISDNGIGLPIESEINQNNSIGFMLINGLAKQIDGEMEISREIGTEYKITIPV